MLDELLDVFDRDRRSDGRKPRKGLRGLLSRLTDGDRDGYDRDRERRRYDSDDRYDDDDRYDRHHDRSDRRERRRYDFDD